MKDTEVMYADDVRAKTAEELESELLNLKKKQFNYRFQKASGQLEKTATIAKNRRDIARIKTILREKKREAAKD